jgi:uncharacterized membrane protein
MENEQGAQQSTTPPPQPPPMPPQQPVGAEHNTLMAILAYIGPLVIVSYLVAQNEPFVKFHIKQGLVLLIGWVIMGILGTTFWNFWWFINLINLGILILAIIGIINASKGEEKELPFVGHIGRKFNI